jgi:hypothetical protein
MFGLTVGLVYGSLMILHMISFQLVKYHNRSVDIRELERYNGLTPEEQHKELKDFVELICRPPIRARDAPTFVALSLLPKPEIKP